MKTTHFCMKRCTLGTLCTFVVSMVLGACEPPDMGNPVANPYGVVTINFDSKGADVEAEPSSITIRPPATTLDSLPVPPTRAGYTFVEWNTASDGSGDTFNEETLIRANILLIVYARWEPLKLDVGIAHSAATLTPIKNGEYDERSTSLTVAVSGADVSKAAFDIHLRPVAGLSYEVARDFRENEKTFVVNVRYDGKTAFPEGAANLYVNLKTPEGYEYKGKAQSIPVKVIDGLAKTRPIPVNQTNIGHFNAYARTDGLNRHYRLMQSMELESPESPETSNWTAIGTEEAPFTGSFDGGGQSIYGLSIHRPDDDDQGLFGHISGPKAVIENLRLEGGSVNGRGTVGGVVGRNSEGRVQNCYVSVSSRSEYRDGGTWGYGVGGVVGSNSGTVQNCYATGSVYGEIQYTGGVMGVNYGGTVRNCVALNSSVTTAGGQYFIGCIGYSGSPMENNYAGCINIRYDVNRYNLGKPVTSDSTGVDGGYAMAGINPGEYNHPSFWTGTMGWNFDEVWDWSSTAHLPVLRGVASLRVLPIVP